MNALGAAKVCRQNIHPLRDVRTEIFAVLARVFPPDSHCSNPARYALGFETDRIRKDLFSARERLELPVTAGRDVPEQCST